MSSMPRQKRLDITGVIHHVIVRGIERKRIFRDDADREEFLRRKGRENTISIARAVFCYTATARLGMSGRKAGEYLGVTQAAVSQSVRRGQAYVESEKLNLLT